MGSLARPRSPAAWAAVTLALAGFGVRIWASAGIWPASLRTHDTAAYVRAAHLGLGKDPLEPTSYSIFLRVAHAISAQLAFTVALQHVLGLASGLLLFLAVRRLGGSVWVALAGAAAIWLSADQIFLEQVLLSETLFVFVLMVAMYALVASRDSHSYVWPALAGGAIVALPFVRGVAVPMVPLLGLFLLYALWRVRGAWIRRAGVALVGALLVVAGYSAVRHHDTGSWSVSTQGGGWAVYSRVAQFADCTKFKPPAGTRPLCESTPQSQRLSVDTYSWQPQSPAIRTFGEPPRGSRQLAEFGLAAIEHQPGDYAHAVLIDMERYVDATAGDPKPGDFSGPGSLGFASAGNPDAEAEREVRSYYDGFRLHAGSAHALSSYQSVFRIHPWLLALLAALSLCGVLLARGLLRFGAVLFGVSGLALLAIPALTTSTTWRYSVPAAPLLAAAGAIGAAWLWPAVATALARVRPARPGGAAATQ